MMQFFRFAFMLMVLLFCFNSSKAQEEVEVNYVDWVNPFIGTDAHGHTFPGATMPFGLMQLSPQTRLDGWDGCSGYHFTDSIMYGFAHTALSGTGVLDYGDILIMPGNGQISEQAYHFASRFDKKSEKASPGYYSVYLEEAGVQADFTCTERSGIHKYRFKKGEDAYIVIDFAHRDKVLEATAEILGDRTVYGMRRSSLWAEDQHVFFHLETSKPIIKHESLFQEIVGQGFGGGMSEVHSYAGEKLRLYLYFDLADDEELEIRIGISGVDRIGARNNMRAELSDKSFEQVKSDAIQTWNKELSKIKVSGGRDEYIRTFYSALYHTMIAPNIWSDVDGRYRGIDNNIHQSGDIPQYTIFSLWDTYRTLHPLLSIIDKDRTLAFVHSFLRIYEQGGLLPVWELAANETFCMIGYHSVPVILDAWRKGIKDFDSELALKAMIHSANQDHFGLDAYRKYGYIPGDKEHESVSKTLEYAYDDWCIAQFAADLGQMDVYETFIQRAQSYKHIFYARTGFMRPRLNGAWKEPFLPSDVDMHFTEANSWQYSFYVPQDIETLIQMHGGKDIFGSRLDELFETEAPLTGRQQSDITGLIGQYAHGNEPSHHMAYLYNFIGEPWKTQKWVKEILRTQYSDQADGLSGNEDCGQMSAWYVMSALGIYPVTPGSNEYIIGSPLFDRAIIQIEDEKELYINAMGASQDMDYVVAASFNGRDWNQSWVSHEDLMQGGTLNFILQKNTRENWGTNPASWPKSKIEDHIITVTPFFSVMERSFEDTLHLEIKHFDETVALQFRQMDKKGWTDWKPYSSPLKITKSTQLEAKAISAEGKESMVVPATYSLFNPTYDITILSKVRDVYAANGPRTLIDGIRGEHDWRLGGWQGYFKDDFEAILDLRKKRKFKKVGAGFNQEIRSWIWLPKYVTFYVSNDGINFEEIGQVNHEIAYDNYEVVSHDFVLEKKTKARYVKIVAKQFGVIPEWHLGKGGKSYLFIDEFWVE